MLAEMMFEDQSMYEKSF